MNVLLASACSPIPTLAGRYWCIVKMNSLVIAGILGVSFLVTFTPPFIWDLIVGFFLCIYGKLRRLYWLFHDWKITSKIERRVELLADNDLRLYIHNKGKEARVVCRYLDILDDMAQKYVPAHNTEMGIIELTSGIKTFFNDVLNHDDPREIKIGIPHNGKIALSAGDTHYYGFRDGMYEYVIGVGLYIVTRNQEAYYELPDLSIWLTIKDGELIGAKEKK